MSDTRNLTPFEEKMLFDALIRSSKVIAEIPMTDAPAPIPEEIHRRAERIAAETREKFAGMIHALDARGDDLSKRAAATVDIMSEESVALIKLRDVLEFDLVHIRKDRAALLARVEELEGLLERFLAAHDEPCRHDHHGNCQAHFLEEDCTVAATRAALAKKGEG